jgi:thiamine biosynthesis lipoprotein
MKRHVQKQMKKTEWIMGMPVAVMIVDEGLDEQKEQAIEQVFEYFRYVDATFSTYKEDSEISRINRGEIQESNYSKDMQEVFALSEKTKQETHGYFDIRTPEGVYDPSGLVKGWSIYHAAEMLAALGYTDFYVDAGGDIEARGHNATGTPWVVGIRDPFSDDKTDIVKTVSLANHGMATSGTYIRSQHIYDPHQGRAALREVASMTVIGPNVYEADRFATAAFAMGTKGIQCIEKVPGLEGYMISPEGIATMTSGFNAFVK